MPNSMDVHLLIAEIKERPALWDVRLPEYKDRVLTHRLWSEITKTVGCSMEQCKRKWKNLRDAYRAEIRRTERRVQSLKLEGHIDPHVTDCKWVYFKPMSFMNVIKRKQYPWRTCNNSHESFSPPETSDVIESDDFCDIKMEPPTSTDDEADQEQQSTSGGVAASILCDDDEAANDMLFEQFNSVATPQAARRLSGTLTFSAGDGSRSPMTDDTKTTTILDPVPIMGNAHGNNNGQRNSNSNANASSNSSSKCKCSQHTEDQVHFLEDLEREEQQLMKSTKRDITRANSVTHFGDSDYNFLVSFLPQMKRLSELQNLQFRAKMSDLMLRIMAQPMATVTTSNFGCIATTTTPCLQGHFECPATTTAAATTTAMMAQKPMLSQQHQHSHQRKQQHP